MIDKGIDLGRIGLSKSDAGLALLVADARATGMSREQYERQYGVFLDERRISWPEQPFGDLLPGWGKWAIRVLGLEGRVARISTGAHTAQGQAVPRRYDPFQELDNEYGRPVSR